MWSLESKFDFNAEDDFLCGKLWQQTECALISSFGLTIKDGLFWLLLVGLDWKPGEHPVVKSTYSGISLVSWLEWEGKTVKDIHMRQDMCWQRQEWSGWRTGLLERRKTANTRTHTQTSKRQSPPASCLWVACLRASETICRLWPGFHTLECLCEELWDEDIEPYAWCLFRFVT